VFWVDAGLKQYDPDGVDASTVEAAIDGVHVIRHGKCLRNT
jgi:phosphatidylglycerophosphatase GEP4